MADHDPKTLVAEDTRRSNVSKLVLLIMMGLIGIIVWFSNPTDNAGTLFGEHGGKEHGGKEHGGKEHGGQAHSGEDHSSAPGVIVPDPELRDYRVTGAAAGPEPASLRVTGKGPAGGKVQLWVNGERAGEFDVTPEGTWETVLTNFPTPPIKLAVGPREGQRAPEFAFSYEPPQVADMQSQEPPPAEAPTEPAPGSTEGDRTTSSTAPAEAAPAIVISNPTDGAALQKGWEFTMRGTAPAGAEVEIMKDGQAVTVVQADAEGKWSHKTKADVGPHTYAVQVKGDPATKREVRITVQ